MCDIDSQLEDRMAAVMILHDRGCAEVADKYNLKCNPISSDDMANVVIDVATDISNYNLHHKTYPSGVDLTKVVTFSAAAMAKRDDDFSAVPLFYAYIDFLDSAYVGDGLSLRNFGESIFFAENLNTMLTGGQWLAPYCYFRAIDLTLYKCAVPAIKSLNMRIDELSEKLGMGVDCDVAAE